MVPKFPDSHIIQTIWAMRKRIYLSIIHRKNKHEGQKGNSYLLYSIGTSPKYFETIQRKRLESNIRRSII